MSHEGRGFTRRGEDEEKKSEVEAAAAEVASNGASPPTNKQSEKKCGRRNSENRPVTTPEAKHENAPVVAVTQSEPRVERWAIQNEAES